MKQRFLLAWVCMFGVMLAGCAYDYDEPQPPLATSSAESTARSANAQEILDLLRGKKPEPPFGIRASSPMPTTGVCSYLAAGKSNTDIRYTVPIVLFIGAGKDVGMVHVERGITVSWPHDIYLQLKAATPEVRDSSVLIFQVTRESFESLVPQSATLKSVVSQMGIDSFQSYFVTSYKCLSPSDQ